VGVGIPNSVRSGSSALRGSWELVVLWFSVCGPFAAWGIRGKKSTPSIGWEVPVKSHLLERGRCIGAGQRLRANDLGYDTHSLILHGRLI
jgi:hypothetical protein